jgi:hypothetical protein
MVWPGTDGLNALRKKYPFPGLAEHARFAWFPETDASGTVTHVKLTRNAAFRALNLRRPLCQTEVSNGDFSPSNVKGLAEGKPFVFICGHARSRANLNTHVDPSGLLTICPETSETPWNRDGGGTGDRGEITLHFYWLMRILSSRSERYTTWLLQSLIFPKARSTC